MSDQGAGLHAHHQGSDLSHRLLHRFGAFLGASHTSHLGGESLREMVEQPTPSFERPLCPLRSRHDDTPSWFDQRQTRVTREHRFKRTHVFLHRMCERGVETRITPAFRRDRGGDLTGDLHIDRTAARRQQAL
jgi:hypothetical protein